MKRTVISLLLTIVASGYAFAQNSKGIDEEVMLTAVNELRTEGCMCGTEEVKKVGAVIWDQMLADIAMNYAMHLENNNQNGDDAYMFMSHVGLDGSTVETRLAEAGYEAKSVVENIAYLAGNESLAIDYWLNNPVSCQNLMAKKMTSMGVARSGRYWVLIMAQTNIKKSKKKQK